MRIRTIKPEFWRSGDITALSREDRLLFIGLWSYVDDNGVGIDDYRAIAADLFALEDDPKDIRDYVREGLATLSRGLLIVRYEVDDKHYIYITKWRKHQRVDRPNKPRYPEPGSTSDPPTSDDANPSREDREGFATPSPSGTEEQRNRVKRTTLAAAAAKNGKTDPLFDVFWSVYPRKVKKDDARLAWKTVQRRKVDPQHVIDAARQQASRWRAEGKEIKYVQYPASWLRAGSYDDEPEQPSLTLVPAAPVLASFEDYRLNAAGPEAAQRLGVAYLPAQQRPSDPTPPQQFQAAAAIEWIDAHEPEIRAALAHERTG